MPWYHPPTRAQPKSILKILGRANPNAETTCGRRTYFIREGRLNSAVTPRTVAAASRDQVHQGYEQRSPDDGPQDGERVLVNGDEQQLRQVEVVSDGHADQCADEAHRDRYEEPAACSSTNRAPNTAANSSNDQQD